MKLERFNKNKKRNIILISSIIGIFLVIGLVYYFKTYAYYTEEKSFNVLKGQISDFTPYVKNLSASYSNNSITLSYEVAGRNSDTITCVYGTDTTYGNNCSNITNSSATIPNVSEDTIYYFNVCSTSVNGTKRCKSNTIAIVVTDFYYTGEEQTFTVPVSGTYKLETWGAQGGTYSDTIYGGYGGYSTGEVSLNAGDVLYINVGGQGLNGANTTVSAGYNGGGTCVTASENDNCGSGGGATHIATKSGLLSTLSSSTSNILIVAGGGGGSYYHSSFNGIGFRRRCFWRTSYF